MKNAKKHASTTSTLRIEGDMTIYRAAELRQTLLASLEQANELEVDLSAVTELDTAGVQILLMIKKLAQDKHRELRLTAHSPAVSEVLELMNLAAYFGDPLVIASRSASTASRA